MGRRSVELARHAAPRGWSPERVAGRHGLAVLAGLLAVHALGACGGQISSDGAGLVTGGFGGFALPSGGDATARGGAGIGGRATGGTPSGGTGTGGAATGGGRATGGTPSGGRATGDTGGTATGGVPDGCTSVASLPAMGSACSGPGESLCDSAGHRCSCSSGIWYCNVGCDPAVPPTQGTTCPAGMFCSYYPYPSDIGGIACWCVELAWYCQPLA
jgi:hypothetical protein